MNAHAPLYIGVLKKTPFKIRLFDLLMANIWMRTNLSGQLWRNKWEPEQRLIKPKLKLKKCITGFLIVLKDIINDRLTLF